MNASNHIRMLDADMNYFLIGGYASYVVPAAAIGAMGYCYMWWKVKL